MVRAATTVTTIGNTRHPLSMEDLNLPKTKLSLSDGVLKKLSKNDALVATFALEDIKDIRCDKSADYAFPLILIAVFSSLAIVSIFYIPWTGLGWTLAIMCGGAALFSIQIIYGRKIVLETDNGTVGYPVADTYEEADGFVVSVKQRLKANS